MQGDGQPHRPLLLEHVTASGACELPPVCTASLPDHWVVQVLLHWACAKVSASADMADEALLSALDSRLKGQPAIRFCPGPAGHSLARMLSVLPNHCC